MFESSYYNIYQNFCKYGGNTDGGTIILKRNVTDDDWMDCKLWKKKKGNSIFGSLDPQKPRRMIMGSGEGSTMRNFIVGTVHLI